MNTTTRWLACLLAGAVACGDDGGGDAGVDTTPEVGPDALDAEVPIALLGPDRVIAGEEAWYIADTIPEGSVAAVVLIEHLWAIPLREAIVDAGGISLADEWIHPQDLIAVGVDAA